MENVDVDVSAIDDVALARSHPDRAHGNRSSRDMDHHTFSPTRVKTLLVLEVFGNGEWFSFI
jgi:hypothetical protein